ncbi:hypothetical protein [Hymenobacter guriensis]|uniref:Uncharacterized protein n=1 Tax=Hymenobacter guriensis TaxID=2793065 RepID=A0ABS0KYB7_9BACT|nr:hypothetical protein [Hymenobacter guriensis]MBG8552343.1 hypothetical protein [Hymenobacter guriensis]
MNTPKNFLGAPAYHPTPIPPHQGVRVVEVPTKKTPDTATLTLTVDRSARVYPSTELMRFLGLKGGQPIDLIPPASRNGLGPWHLDCRPTAGATLTHTPNSFPQFKARQHLNPKSFCHYLGRGQYGTCYERITLMLEITPLQDFDYYTFRPVFDAHPPK